MALNFNRVNLVDASSPPARLRSGNVALRLFNKVLVLYLPIDEPLGI